jgi:hypothetical protein
MSLRTLQRRVAKIEKGRKPRLSPFVIMYGSFEAFAGDVYVGIRAGVLSDEWLILLEALRSWETNGTWDVAYATA